MLTERLVESMGKARSYWMFGRFPSLMKKEKDIQNDKNDRCAWSWYFNQQFWDENPEYHYFIEVWKFKTIDNETA